MSNKNNKHFLWQKNFFGMSKFLITEHTQFSTHKGGETCHNVEIRVGRLKT